MKMRFPHYKNALFLCVLLSLLCTCNGYCSGSFIDHLSSTASGSVTKFAVAGELALLADGKNGKQEAMQGVKALAATTLVVQGLKFAVGEKRPNSDSRTSFPSGHTAEAFAMATVLADYHPKSALWAYTAASVVGWSRVHEKAHYWHDVVAGALIGHFIAKKFTSGNFGLNPDGTVGYHSRW
jgi:membrane-associated phospholipid phosphatase